MSPHLALLLLAAFLTFPADALVSSRLGINYGQLGSNLPSPALSVSLLQSINAARVKLYDANPSILAALAGTGIQVTIMVPNQLIPAVAANRTAADEWVDRSVLPFHPRTRVRYVLVGNEILSDQSIRNSTWHLLVPAMANIRRSLSSRRLTKVKVGTPLAMDALSSSFPPSAGSFRPDIADSVVRPLLRFLDRTNSFYFVDVYPYFVWAANPRTVALDYALLQPTAATRYTDPGTGLVYTNMLDQQLDAVAFAMRRLGYSRVRISIAETGWPNAGDYNQIGANPSNAAIYNRNLARRVARGVGTPARPAAAGRNPPAFVFALFNEDRKGGPGTERHWGVFYPNESAVYSLDLSGKTPDDRFPPLPPATNNEPYRGEIWCVVAEAARGNLTELGAAVAYACGQGKGTCDAIRPGGRCSGAGRRHTEVVRASYAFNAYWQQFRRSGGTCYFGGLAEQTVRDPSETLIASPLALILAVSFFFMGLIVVRCAVQVTALASSRVRQTDGRKKEFWSEK